MPVRSAGNDAAAGQFIYQMSSWTRAIVIPLSIVHAHESAAARCPTGFNLNELFVPGREHGVPRGETAILTWRNFFLMRRPRLEDSGRGAASKRMRRQRHSRAEQWMLERPRTPTASAPSTRR